MLNKKYRIGIDASNIRQGGGITHLSQLLQHAEPDLSEISRVVVWSNQKTLNKLPEKKWLIKQSNKRLDGNFLSRTLWQVFKLDRALEEFNCDLLFVPGASFKAKFRPVVSMHQNQLPFEWAEILRYGFSFMTLKWILLRMTQSLSFKKSNGIIFLSKYSKDSLIKIINKQDIVNKIIPHGVEDRFFSSPKEQFSIENYSTKNPLKIIYISTIDFYKHQWNIAEAVKSLKRQGYPIDLKFYGSANSRALKKLKKVIIDSNRNKYNENDYISYNDEVSFTKIENVYFNADISIFASSCETFGQIVLESMAAGLPIACSNMSSMPEILKNSAVLFDPLNVKDITNCLKKLIDSKGQRTFISSRAAEIAQDFSWKKTAFLTFEFFKEVSQQDELKRK